MTISVLAMSSSSEFTNEAKAWDLSKSIMEQLLHGNKSGERNSDVSLAQRNLELIDATRNEKEAILRESEMITSSIKNDVEREKKSLDSENNDLSRQIQRVQRLEEELGKLRRDNTDIVVRRKEAEKNIPIFKVEAAQEIEKIDEVQMRHIRAVPKIKMEYSLFATMTNVKWDYTRTDVLAGEVSIPSKSIHRQFQIDKDISDFEIAQKFWSIMEG